MAKFIYVYIYMLGIFADNLQQNALLFKQLALIDRSVYNKTTSPLLQRWLSSGLQNGSEYQDIAKGPLRVLCGTQHQDTDREPWLLHPWFCHISGLGSQKSRDKFKDFVFVTLLNLYVNVVSGPAGGWFECALLFKWVLRDNPYPGPRIFKQNIALITKADQCIVVHTVHN